MGIFLLILIPAMFYSLRKPSKLPFLKAAISKVHEYHFEFKESTFLLTSLMKEGLRMY